MDVKRTCLLSSSLLILTLLLTSCASKKEPADIFSGPPSESALVLVKIAPLRIVLLLNGKTKPTLLSKRRTKNLFFKDFVKPQIDKIERAEFDYRVSIHDFQENIASSLSSEASVPPYHLNIVEASTLGKKIFMVKIF